MRMTSFTRDLRHIAFAKKAADWFGKNPKGMTYSADGDLTPGSLLAIRWGMDMDCVVVVKLDECFQPVNYQNEIREGE